MLVLQVACLSCNRLNKLSATLARKFDGAAKIALSNPVAVFIRVKVNAVAHKLGHLFSNKSVLLVAAFAVTMAERFGASTLSVEILEKGLPLQIFHRSGADTLAGLG